MMKARTSFGIVFHEPAQYIYVIGGEQRSAGYMKDCEKYSIINDEWTNVAPMVVGSVGGSACIVDN